ncbi:DUF262 domain-containing protein [Hymenobacter metallicola]|uniref:DUF262 domain-containing protein n=2 Tax=Hymenobacter metallicola TaxID=2563114 RepID=A0A4Z0QEG2_9BACT|nr:DUF262 domain-containing protein [Hymenobacter metallicola]
MDDFSIRQLLSHVKDGLLRIPTFQRGFVWDAEKVAFLMDSIYKGYPIGSLLIWRTREQLDYDRKLGPFVLPTPKKEYPIDYLLDGQQRVTSIFGVFQTEIQQDERDSSDWMNIYFDLYAKSDAQESQFVALAPDQVESPRHFPLKLFFNVGGFGKAMRGLPEDLALQIDAVQTKFTEARIPAELLTTDDKTTVAIVFERVNRRGVPLDTLQLLTAWTWSQEFHLQKQFENLTLDLKPFGFQDVGDDSNLLIRCCSAVLAGNASTDTLMKLNGASVRSRFNEVESGLKGAVDFLRNNLHVYSLENLPSPSILIPLAVFFATPNESQLRVNHTQKSAIIRWFWRTCFNRRYNSQPAKTIQSDIESMLKLKANEPSNLGIFPYNQATPEWFKLEQFRVGTVFTKTFVLLLAQKKPLTFISGSPISLASTLKSYNKNEFHHLYPKSFVKTLSNPSYDVNCLANISFMSRVDNNTLGGVAPSVYRAKMEPKPEVQFKILSHAFCYPTIFNDDFNAFIDERATLLANEANRLMN